MVRRSPYRQKIYRVTFRFQRSEICPCFVKYADYYRRAKIEETVFELLTEQYEMAKCRETRKLRA